MRALARIEGVARLRYMTSHPRDMDDDLIAAHADLPQAMPYLHLPVQSGSDRILRAMNRDHRVEDYLRLIERVRAARPDIALSSDFIVGFPGESAADFEATLDLIREVKFAQAFSFKYSRRPGTPAAEMAQQISEEEKGERLARLQDLLIAQQRAFNAACIGRTLPVLIVGPGRNPGQLHGKSPYLQSVHMDDAQGAANPGEIVDVTITSAALNGLGGTLALTGALENAL
jgi:tRNA-2-methylthio-N6-dimethylallyladenosine synthase